MNLLILLLPYTLVLTLTNAAIPLSENEDKPTPFTPSVRQMKSTTSSAWHISSITLSTRRMNSTTPSTRPVKPTISSPPQMSSITSSARRINSITQSTRRVTPATSSPTKMSSITPSTGRMNSITPPTRRISSTTPSTRQITSTTSSWRISSITPSPKRKNFATPSTRRVNPAISSPSQMNSLSTKRIKSTAPSTGRVNSAIPSASKTNHTTPFTQHINSTTRNTRLVNTPVPNPLASPTRPVDLTTQISSITKSSSSLYPAASLTPEKSSTLNLTSLSAPTSSYSSSNGGLLPTQVGGINVFSTSRVYVEVSHHHTIHVSEIGLIIFGIGEGGFVIAGGEIYEVAGGTEAIVEEGEDGEPTVAGLPVPDSSTLTASSTASSTTLKTGTPTAYIVGPIDSSSSAQQSQVYEELTKIAQSGTITTISVPGSNILFWTAQLTSNDASQLNQNPIVAFVMLDPRTPVDMKYLSKPPSSCPGSCKNVKRDDNIKVQTDPLIDLRMISQPPGVPLGSLPIFAYNSIAGRGITVYIMDSGANINHPEWAGMPGTKRWLFTIASDHVMDDPMFPGHGSCIASKVAGPRFGVAKNANIVMVKLETIDGGSYSFSSIIRAFTLISEDIDANGLGGKAVVNLSWNWPIADLDEWMLNTLISSLHELLNRGVAVVCSSGNTFDESGSIPDINSVPALLGQAFPLIVVGGVDFNGNLVDFSRGGNTVTVTAPGIVICATGDDQATSAEGTSFAAGTVAGLAAYLMSLEPELYQSQQAQLSNYVRDRILQLAHTRPGGDSVVVWNGVDAQNYCPAPLLHKRQTNSGGMGCLASSSLPFPPFPPAKFGTSTTVSMFTAISSSSNTTSSSSNTTLPSSTTTSPSSTTTSSSSTATLSSIATAPSSPTTTTSGPQIVFGTISTVTPYPIPTPLFAIVFEERFNSPPYTECLCANFYGSIASHSDPNYNNDPEDWCMNLCGNDPNCLSVLLVEVYDSSAAGDFFICNLLNSQFSPDDLACQSGSEYCCSMAFNKII